jgi:hypothetical protein
MGATFLATLLMVCPSSSTSADDLPQYTIMRVAGPITLDGVLAEPTWVDGSGYGG